MGAWIVFGEKLSDDPGGGSVMARAMWGEREFGILVDEPAQEVASALSRGFARLTRRWGGKESDVWVNPANVLFVEEYEMPKSERESGS